MIHIGLFEGIGGFSLASRWMGWQTLVTCEIAEFPRKVLQYHFPKAYHHEDIKTLTYQTINHELTEKYGQDWRSDDIILTGGFPCQPYSLAGKRLGKEDERHLWPEMLRIIREVQPTWIVGENVYGIVNWNDGMVFDEVQADLETEGYEVQAYVLPAAAVNAPHRRDRVWFVAKNTISDGCLFGESEQEGTEVREQRNISTGSSNGFCLSKAHITNTNNERLERSKINGSVREVEKNRNKQSTGCIPPTWQNFPTQSPVCGRNDGIPDGLDGITFSKWRSESIKAYGNAVVPQVVFQIFKTIELYTNQNQ